MALNIVKPYETYMIVWMDMLGFKNKVMKFRHDQNEIQNMLKILRQVEELTHRLSSKPKDSIKAKASVFSDSIVLTSNTPNIFDMYYLLYTAAFYQFFLAAKRYFLRGAAVIDSYYSEDNISFGPAIIRALDMEKCAVWPRILISNDLLSQVEAIPENDSNWEDYAKIMKKPLSFIRENYREINELFKQEVFRSIIRIDREGLQYIDYLSLAFNVLTQMKWLSGYLNLPRELQEIIEMDFLQSHKDAIIQTVQSDEIRDNTYILAKYHSLAIYHNDVVNNLQTTSYKELEQIISYSENSFLWVPISKHDKNSIFNTKLRELIENKNGLENYKINLLSVFPKFQVA